MRSSFFGLNIATQGLYTAQTALNVTNHNISNAETKGYSRQYAEIKAMRALPDAARGMVGTGSEVTGIFQHRSVYLDAKYWNMATDFGQYKIKEEMLGQLELLFNEPSDTGYNTYLSDMFESLQGFSTNPAEDAYVSGFVDSASSFAMYFNNLGERMDSYQREANFGVKTCVTEINTIAEQLAAVNIQIANIELGGVVANDLRDERALLVDQLSQIINIEAKETIDINGNKSFSVTINGQVLVNGAYLNGLKVEPRDSKNNPEDQPDLYDVYWQSGKRLYLNNPNTSGKLKGYLDVRDGNNGQNFTGNIDSIIGTDTLIIKNPSRLDIADAGEIRIGMNILKYDGITYDETNDTMTFTLETTVPASVAAGDKVQIGEAVAYKGIPYYKQQLNEFVRTMAKEFNQIHRTGNGGEGKELFSYTGYTVGFDEGNDFTYKDLTINNFSFSQEILKDNDLLFTSTTKNAGESANDLLLKLLDLQHDTDMFKKGEPGSFMQAVISELGIDSKQATSFKTGQENLTKLIDNQRLSISSVDINEETTDMLRFQQAYNLSAKMIAVMDEIYDVTINQLKR